MRGVFTIFFAHSLYREVESTIDSQGVEHTWNSSFLATCHVVAQIASNVMLRLPDSTDKVVIPLELFVLLPLIDFLLYRAQCATNAAGGGPVSSTNSHFSWASYVWMAIGAMAMVPTLISYARRRPCNIDFPPAPPDRRRGG